MENYIDSAGNVIVLKSIRPLIDYPETILGSMRGAIRQFRHGNLHIREYEEYYTTHMDVIDPRKDPLGHLLIDAPEYLIALLSGLWVVQHGISGANKRRRAETNDIISSNNTVSGIVAKFVISSASILAVNFMKNWMINNSK